MPTTPVVEVPTKPELSIAVVTALAEVRACSIEELEDEMRRRGGALELESPEAVAIIAKLERRYERRLAKVEDLEPEELTSVDVLAGLLHRRWPTGSNDAVGEG